MKGKYSLEPVSDLGFHEIANSLSSLKEEARRESIHILPVSSQVIPFTYNYRICVLKLGVPKISLKSLLECKFLGQDEAQ